MEAQAQILPDGRADQRHAPRRRVLLGGRVVEPDGAFSTSCTIRDVNDAGAKVRLPAPVPVGEHVYLIELRSGVAHQVKVAWRKNGDMGLTYENEVVLEESSDPRIRMLRRLWLGGAAR
jgi:hypothetical protein